MTTHAPSNLNIANLLSISRILAVPVMVVLLVQDNGQDGLLRFLAALVFVLASITDFVDGAVARRMGWVTSFGKLIDPIADKALTGAALITLSALGDLVWWVTIVILVREIGITVLRLMVIKYGVIAASRGGKLKTALLTLGITLYLLVLPTWFEPIQQAVMLAAVVVTVVTGADYVHRAWRLVRGS